MMKTEIRIVGIVSESPKQSCNDVKCPFHGKLSVRGRIFTGTIISAKMRKTAVIEFERLHFLGKFERYEKRKTSIKAHNPECINARDGDIVRIAECRPISKTKTFVIVQKLGIEKGFKEKIEAIEAAKADQPKKEVMTVEN